jgi:hypothetical protein
MPTTGSSRAAQLLLRSLETLKPNERRLVLEALLTGSIGRLGPLSRAAFHPMGSPTVEMHATGSQVNQPLMIRLPSSLHARLRKWSVESGFSMAAVARGLIERFLDEQDAGA